MITLDGNTLTLESLAAIACQNEPVSVCKSALPGVERSCQLVQSIVEGNQQVYSINTGFGALSKIAIAKEDVAQLQLNFVRSHAAGVGEALSTPVVRAMMALRANTLAKGYSGVRPQVIDLLLEMLNKGVHPIVPSQGSLGASGDLAPLAHLALVLIGEGEAWVGNERLGGKAALTKVGLQPLVLQAKEGLALVNGTQMMTAIGALNVLQAERLCKLADLAAAISIDGFMGSHKPFVPEVQRVRNHPGQIVSAANIHKLLSESEIAQSHASCKKVQDPYSFRCTPQVHGAVRDTISFARGVIEREMNAATDNPLLFADTGEAISQGNFHGEPVAFAMDYLGIAMAELGSISERRIDKLNDPAFSELPAFLTMGQQGLNSGTMIVHYTAASLVSENKVLAHPASVDSIPSSNNKEDHVSMGSIAARKAATIIGHVQYILATELFCATQALRFRHPLRSGAGVEVAFEKLSTQVPPIVEDRVFRGEIQALCDSLNTDDLLHHVEATVGELG